jgi:hypothetical protein
MIPKARKTKATMTRMKTKAARLEFGAGVVVASAMEASAC